MLVIALDPATNTGVCVGEIGKTPILSAQRFRASRKDELEDIYGRAAFFMANLLRTYEPDLVAIETPIRVKEDGRTHHDVIAIAHGLYGIFAGIARARQIRVLRADVRTWRKYFLGAGNLKRDDAKAACVRLCAHLKWSAPTEDAAEAAGIWLWGCSKIDPRKVQRHEPLFTGDLLDGRGHG